MVAISTSCDSLRQRPCLSARHSLLAEYAIGTNPLTSTSSGSDPISFLLENNYLVAILRRNPDATDIVYRGKCGQGLTDWDEFQPVVLSDTASELRIRSPFMVTEKSGQFLKFEITGTP
jgi:hypothetical protein